MKIACGTDIIEVKRIEDCIENLQEKFLDKIYTKNEIAYCEQKNQMKYQHYAARFAAKEAIYKAISEILENKYEITWKDVEILPNEKGKPIVNFIKKYSKIKQIDISLSHLKEYAVAICVLQIEE